jgi:threonine dehydrogenase-like Zn-dependent dehydrogenase
MLAAVFHDIGDVRLTQRPTPEIVRDDDVRIAVLGTGVCGTDRAILRGVFPARGGVILGHEAIGRVEAVGAKVSRFAIGDTVIVNPTMFCGRCAYCMRGRPGLCRAKAGTEVGVDRDGTFAEHAVLPERFLFAVPRNLPIDRAVLVEPVACVLNNLRAARIDVTDHIAVLGGGPIGALCAIVAQRTSRAITIVEQDTFRSTLCRELVPRATLVEPPKSDDWRAWATGLPRGRPTAIIDTTGVLLEQAVDAVADGGRVVAMGFNAKFAMGFNAKSKVSIRYQDLVARSLSVLGAGDYDESIFPHAIDVTCELPVERLVTHRVPLGEFDRVRDLLALGTSPDYFAMKVVVER